MKKKTESKTAVVEDDGRTLANMNVEGMPGYQPHRENISAPSGEKPQLTPAESRAALWGVLGAALLVAGVFALVYFLFISFCDFVWFA